MHFSFGVTYAVFCRQLFSILSESKVAMSQKMHSAVPQMINPVLHQSLLTSQTHKTVEVKKDLLRSSGPLPAPAGLLYEDVM